MGDGRSLLFLVSPGGEKNLELLVLNPKSGVAGEKSQSIGPVCAELLGTCGQTSGRMRKVEEFFI